MTSCPPQGGRAGPPGGPLAHQRADEQRRGDRLAGHVGDGRADQPQPGRVHQQRAEHEADQAAGEHVAHRPAQLLHAAQPAVAGQRDQQQRRAEPGDPQPLLPRLGDRTGAAGEQPGQRAGEQLEEQRARQAEPDGQPGGLHALGDRAGAVAGPARRAARAVVP